MIVDIKQRLQFQTVVPEITPQSFESAFVLTYRKLFQFCVCVGEVFSNMPANKNIKT